MPRKRIRSTRSLIEQNRSTIIQDLISTPYGRTQLAQNMIQPLKTRFNWSELARNIVSVTPLPAKESIYHKVGNEKIKKELKQKPKKLTRKQLLMNRKYA